MTRYIKTWNPVREMAAMQHAIDRVFDETWRSLNNGDNPAISGNWLALDIQENDDMYTVVADLPGINPDDIDITLHDHTLTIAGEVVREELPDGTRSLLAERTVGKFRRTVNLPNDIDSDRVEASYENGVLHLTLPKSEISKPRQISVNSKTLLSNGNGHNA